MLHSHVCTIANRAIRNTTVSHHAIILSRDQKRPPPPHEHMKKEKICYTSISKSQNKKMSLQHRTVVSFLSPSARASRLAQEKLAALLGWKAIIGEQKGATSTADAIDRVSLECPRSGTVLQWLTFDKTQSDRKVDERNPFRLLAVQDAPSALTATQQLQQAIEASTSSTKMKLKRMFGQPVTAKDLLGKSTLPLLNFQPSFLTTEERQQQKNDPFVDGCLKEIAIPTFDDAVYSDGQTLREHLSAAPLHRPVTGLYQLTTGSSSSNGLCLRPLPTGVEDRKLSAPSLVIHQDSLENLSWVTEMDDGQMASTNGDFYVYKIGYNGIGKGQLMIRSPDWCGIDLRFCQHTKHRAGFNEAQEALLAGSLPSIQSTHVLDGARGTIDPRTDKMDCWVEFRASVRNPLGFWSNRRNHNKPRIAKVPDIPYE